MTILLFSLIVYLGSFLAKGFYIFIRFDSENDFRKNLINDDQKKLLLTHTLIPFSSFFTREDFIKKRLFQLVELFSIILFLIFSLSLREIYDQNTPDILNVSVHFSLFLFSISGLLYLAVHDILYLNIPVIFTVRLLFFSVVLQGIVALFKFFEILDSELFENIGNLTNLAGFIVLYLLTYLLIIITKEEGIGAGDADINGFVGLMLGLYSSIIFIFTTIFVGAFIGVVYSLIIKKFRGVLIPMVPLIAIGYVISIGYSERIINLLLIY